MSENGGTRSCTAVLDDALEELRQREDRLLAFERELAEVRRAIKVLERASGDRERTPGPKGGPGPKAGDTKRAILDAVRSSLEPLDVEGVAAAIGRKPGGWLSMQLAQMVERGELVAVEGGYGMPSRVAAADA